MKMKLFSAGYQVMSGEPDYFSDIVRDYQDRILEIYFAWPGEPSGRAPVELESLGQMQEELARIKSWGIKLNLLFNSSCYGQRALTQELADHVTSLVRQLCDTTGLDAVTTMSPVVANTVKQHFPTMDVRASVNLRLGTVKGMQYAAHFFDSYCVQREYNRDTVRLKELQAWAKKHDKRLSVLANSGCLNFCSFQTFHDNAVAHETRINAQKNIAGITTLCREYYARPEHWVNFLQGSWIRPEDIVRHQRHFAGSYKLATRLHDNPRLVIDAYARGKHHGNLLDLMEPGHGPLFYPRIVDNTRFPDDWFNMITRCDKRCEACACCQDVLKKVLVRIEQGIGMEKVLSAP